MSRFRLANLLAQYTYKLHEHHWTINVRFLGVVGSLPLDAQAGAVLVLGREVYSKSMGLSVDRGEYAGQDAIDRVISVVERVAVG